MIAIPMTVSTQNEIDVDVLNNNPDISVDVESETQVVPMIVSTQETSIDMSVSNSNHRIKMGVSAEYNPTTGGGGGGEGSCLPKGGYIGDLLTKRSLNDYDAEWVTPANSAEQDNTRPITAAAVYTEIGNINALLATI